MNLAGYANRVAWVDLTSGQVDYKPVAEEDARKYIGARGLGVKYVLDNGAAVEPLSDENILCILNGPLSGTAVNMSGRLAVVTKSPLTGTVTDSHMGGWTAAKLKWAGFDGLIFKGRAPKPTYVVAENGTLEFKDASDLWGRGIHETVRILRERHGEEVSVMAIGPAGENQVRFAAILNEDDRASGRGGTGAVLGYKNVKAVVIKGDQKNMPKPANKEAFEVARKRALQALIDSDVTSPNKGGLSVYGTNVLMNISNEVGALPTRNAQVTNFELADAISGEAIREHILVAEPTCHACPVACKKEVEVKDGKYQVRVESFEYESAWALGANCDLGDREAIAYLIYLCNDYGMDTIELGNTFSTAMEAYEKGLHDEELAWGDADKMVTLTGDIARRQGFGDVLAEGPARAAAKWGDPELSMSCKGQSIPAYDPRGIKGIGLGYATSNRGACHLRGYTVASEILGIPEQTDRLAEAGKGELLKVFQDLHAISDSFDICKFSSFAQGVDEYLDQYKTFVGVDITADELMQTGERIYNLERYYNNLAGFGRDELPKRFLEEPATGGSEGATSDLDAMLDEYYRARGWQNGVVPAAKLAELGIEVKEESA